MPCGTKWQARGTKVASDYTLSAVCYTVSTFEDSSSVGMVGVSVSLLTGFGGRSCGLINTAG